MTLMQMLRESLALTGSKNRCSAGECGAEFENHIKAMGQIKADSVEQLKVGMKVKPGWEPIRVQ